MPAVENDFVSRRTFVRSVLAGSVGTVGLVHRLEAYDKNNLLQAPPSSLKNEIGFTTGSLSHQRTRMVFTALTLPKFVRDELGMRMIDFNTNWLTSFTPKYIDQVRSAAESAGCFFTNLKVNHKFGDLYSKDAETRRVAMKNARELVATAKRLGARWIRFPVPKPIKASITESLSAHQQLAGLAQMQGLQMLVENNGWMRAEPESVQAVVKQIGHNVAAGPDTGNWNSDIQYKGIADSFRNAVTCDFKVFELDEQRHHKKYDIKRCFDLAWQAGFRGPWAIEHWNTNNKNFAQEMTYLRDLLESWIKDAST